MDDTPESRTTRYRETAAALRRHAVQFRSDHAAVKQLLSLANGWDQLAASVEKEQLRLGW
jgi:hypothetical protein